MNPSRARDEAAWLYRALADNRLIVGSSGNVSVRTPGGMIITPSGGSPDDVTAADLVSMILEDEHVASPTSDRPKHLGAMPSSEWELHAVVYRVCPEASFVAHTHADACTALACLDQALPAFHYMVVQFGGEDVRCAPYTTFGTRALAQVTATAIRGRSACLLANHGMVVCAGSAAATLNRCILLETLCRQYLLARSAGTPRLLTTQEMLDARERFKTYGRLPHGSPASV